MNPQKQRKIDALLQQGYSLDAVRCIQEGWEILKQNLGSFIGFTLLTVLLSVVSICFCFIPFIFAGNLLAGPYSVSMKMLKRQPVTFENFFDGFRNSNFPQILLTTLVIGAITTVVYIPVYAIQLFINLSSDSLNDPRLLAIYGLATLVGWVAVIAISIIYVFAVPLILDQRLEFWPAMELSRKIASQRWGSFLGLFILLQLLNFAGALLCGLGLLLTTPLYFCAITAAYHQVIGLDD